MESKQVIYDAYVTSGQSGLDPTAALVNAQKEILSGNVYYERIIKRFFPPDFNCRILDLGCGHGYFLSLLLRYGYHNLAGVDVSAEQVAIAHQLHLTDVHLGDALSFLELQSDADVVCCFDLIEHLSLEQAASLVDGVYRLLTPGGLFLLHVPNAEGLFGQRIRYGDLTHETCFTPRSITQLLRPVGFGRVNCFEDKPIPHGFASLLRRIIWDLGTVWPRLLLTAETGASGFILSQNMLVVAEKSPRL